MKQSNVPVQDHFHSLHSNTVTTSAVSTLIKLALLLVATF